MPELLFDKLARLRHRVRSLLLFYGLCWLTIAFFLTAVLAGLIDWLWHIDDSGVRLLLGLTILGTTGWTAWRFLWRPLRVTLSDVELAIRIERQQGDLQDLLSSTVEFLESGVDARTGSPALQREAIRRTLVELDRVRIDSVLDTRPLQRVATWAIATCVLVGCLVGFNQSAAATAMHRLMFPFATIPWPRDVELRFVSENLQPLAESSTGGLTVVHGDTLELFVENTRGELPADLALVHRRADGRIVSEPMRSTRLWDAAGQARDIGAASLLITEGPLFFWARGGDGETLPFQVDVVPPPRIESFRVSIHPPAYSKRPEEQLPENVGHIDALMGTRITILARSNKPLQSAVLQRRQEPPLPLVVSDDGRELSGEFVLDRAGSSTWWIEQTDRQGFQNPDADRFDIRVSADQIPSVVIEQPETDRFVTPDAKIPIRLLVKDDLGIRSVGLAWETPSLTLKTALPPSAGGTKGAAEQDSADSPAAPTSASPATTGSESRTSINTANGGEAITEAVRSGFESLLDTSDAPQLASPETNWDLAVRPWGPGTRIVLRGEARDWFNIEGEHVGRSNPRTITIISSDEKRAELTDRQAGLLLDLERATAAQQKNRELIHELQVQLDTTGSLRPEDLDLLKRIELDQRQISDRLTSGNDSLEQRAEQIQQERSNNHIPDVESETLLQTLLAEMSFLRTEPLPAIEQRLTEARKISGEGAKLSEADTQRLQTSLTDAARQQDAALRALADLLSDLQQWKSSRNLNADLRGLTDQQDELTRAAAEIRQRTGGQGTAQLNRQDQADLEKLATRQRGAADEVDGFRQQLEAATEELRDSEPEQAAAFDDARRLLDESGLAGQMRLAASDLSRNQVGAAVTRQQELLETMRKVQNLLDNRDITDTLSLVKQLTESRQQIDELRLRQESLQNQLADAAGNPDAKPDELQLERLQHEEQQLRQELEQTLRRLSRTRSSASSATGRAADQMRRAEDALGRGDVDAAREAVQESLDDLEQVQRELADDQRQLEEQLAREQLEKLADQLTALASRQEAAIAETQRLQIEYDAAGKWPRTLLKSLVNLVTIQRDMAEETRRAADAVDAVEVIAIALRGAAGFMDRAADRLDDRDAAADTVALQTRARQRFLDLIESLAKSSDDGQPNDQNDTNPGEAGPQNAGPEGDLITLIAQLKVIRSLQQDLMARLQAIVEKSEPDQLSEADITELSAIAAEQEQLADLARELTSFFGEPEVPDDSPLAPPTPPAPEKETLQPEE